MAEDVGTETVVNREMAAAWDGEEGEDWAREWRRYDQAVTGHHRVLLDAAAIGVSERVLDVGCGNGQVSRDAARAASAGRVVGVDLSSRMLERARELARAEGLGNVRFEQADAQVHVFQPAGFDLALSRFGAMFFADRVAALANIGTALRPGGRLAVVAWREVGDNEWLRALLDALALGRQLPVPPPGSPGPFGLADAEGVGAALTAAGFEAVDIRAVDRPVWLGADVEDAFSFFSGTGMVRGMTQALDDVDRERALDAARTVIAQHATGDGVYFGSGAWLIVARRPSSG